jgi:hypothetical protein
VTAEVADAGADLTLVRQSVAAECAANALATVLGERCHWKPEYGQCKESKKTPRFSHTRISLLLLRGFAFMFGATAILPLVLTAAGSWRHRFVSFVLAPLPLS